MEDRRKDIESLLNFNGELNVLEILSNIGFKILTYKYIDVSEYYKAEFIVESSIYTPTGNLHKHIFDKLTVNKNGLTEPYIVIESTYYEQQH